MGDSENENTGTSQGILSLEKKLGFDYLKYAQYTALYFACAHKHRDIVLDLLLHNGQPLRRILYAPANTGESDNAQQQKLWRLANEAINLLVNYNADYRQSVRCCAFFFVSFSS